MTSNKKMPIIGTIFSSDSSDSETHKVARYAKTSVSESETPKKNKLRAVMTSAGERSESDASKKCKTQQNQLPTQSPDGYTAIDMTRAGNIKPNTLIQYEKADGKLVKNKYFKKCDRIAGAIVVGFYTHGKRNYSESISNIKSIYIQSGAASGGADALKDTIEMPAEQWKTLRREMIISYQKDSNEFVYKAKFNAFVKSKEGSTRMSLTSEKGFSYIANPDKILKIYRHITPNDKTLAYVLESLQKLEKRISNLEQRYKK
jgi:hypothetical protein